MTVAVHPVESSSSPPVNARLRPAGVRVDGVAFDCLTEAQTNAHIVDEIRAGRGGWVMTSNLDHLCRSRRDPDFRQMFEEADLVVADGAPLIWASRLQGTPLPERVAGSSMAWTLSEAAADAGLSVFLLGGDEGTAGKAAQHLKGRFLGLRIAGVFYPPMGFENDPAMMESMRQALRDAQPDLIYVALGSPKQEKLIRQLREELPQAWWLGLGISLSFICGEVRRAPAWMQKLGLEWVHRMIQEPRRLVRRYLIDGVPYGLRLVSSSVCKRFICRRSALLRAEEAVAPAGLDDPLSWRGSDSQTNSQSGEHSWGA
ncbi:MAG: WecB/TagA/CpsF family glycosyltransferase [Algisphaera sp.]